MFFPYLDEAIIRLAGGMAAIARGRKRELQKCRSQPIFIMASFASPEAGARCADTMARFRFSDFPHVTSLAVS
jgi:hypothetical protein